jgi:spore coat protein U-like protein
MLSSQLFSMRSHCFCADDRYIYQREITKKNNRAISELQNLLFGSNWILKKDRVLDRNFTLWTSKTDTFTMTLDVILKTHSWPPTIY